MRLLRLSVGLLTRRVGYTWVMNLLLALLYGLHVLIVVVSYLFHLLSQIPWRLHIHVVCAVLFVVVILPVITSLLSRSTWGTLDFTVLNCVCEVVCVECVYNQRSLDRLSFLLLYLFHDRYQ